MSPHRKPWGLDPELLEPEAWDCPARLSAQDCLDETGPDWRRASAHPSPTEDDQ